MALDSAANFVQVQVSTGYTSTNTSVILSTSPAPTLPTAPYNMTWWNVTDYPNPTTDPNVEIVRVTSATTVSGTTTLTISRGQESTTASAKNSTGKIYNMINSLTAKVINTDLPATFVGGAANLTAISGIPFVTSTGTVSAASNFIWNSSSNLLGVNSASPGCALHVVGKIGRAHV